MRREHGAGARRLGDDRQRGGVVAEMLEMHQVDAVLADDVGERHLLRRIGQAVEPADLVHVEPLQHDAAVVHQVTLAVAPQPEEHVHRALEHRRQGLLIDLDAAPLVAMDRRVGAHQHTQLAARGRRLQRRAAHAELRPRDVAHALQPMGVELRRCHLPLRLQRALRPQGRALQQPAHRADQGRRVAHQLDAAHRIEVRAVHRLPGLHHLGGAAQPELVQPRPGRGRLTDIAVAGVVAEHGQRDAARVGEVDERLVADRPLNRQSSQVGRQRRQVLVGRTDQLQPRLRERVDDPAQALDPVRPHGAGEEDVVLELGIRPDRTEVERLARRQRQVVAAAAIGFDAGGIVGEDEVEQLGVLQVVLQHERVFEQPEHDGAERPPHPAQQRLVQPLAVDADQHVVQAGRGDRHQRAVVRQHHVLRAEQRLGRVDDGEGEVGIRVVREVGVVDDGHARPLALSVSTTCRARWA